MPGDVVGGYMSHLEMLVACPSGHVRLATTSTESIFLDAGDFLHWRFIRSRRQ